MGHSEIRLGFPIAISIELRSFGSPFPGQAGFGNLYQAYISFIGLLVFLLEAFPQTEPRNGHEHDTGPALDMALNSAGFPSRLSLNV